ncbi:MAG: superoxide dismutase [Dysgonamonadaceae bacterium]|jgi:Fe-Mn family superoxide dismutase|nr:superoxide dismutase [Dysgonamonadaceae bacterium]
MKFEMPQLNYGIDALEPAISQRTIEFHFGKHLSTYVNNLNNLIPNTPFENASLETIIKNADGAIFNNGAQVWNHTFYFNSFSPKGTKVLADELSAKINEQFGDFENFKKEFGNAAVSIFGSGWAWLVKDGAGKLSIRKESNAGNPLRDGFEPLLVFDVWEHAYYLDYQNKRADHINALWNIVDWNVVAARYSK